METDNGFAIRTLLGEGWHRGVDGETYENVIIHPSKRFSIKVNDINTLAN